MRPLTMIRRYTSCTESTQKFCTERDLRFITVWRATDVLRNPWYWFLAGVISLLVVEAAYALCQRKGQQVHWFCPSIFLYLSSSVPPIWALELDRLLRHNNITTTPNSNQSTNEEALTPIDGMALPFVMSADMWVLTIEQTQLLILILGRWMLPRGQITRDQLSQLLFVYVGIASDIMEFPPLLFEEKGVLTAENLWYVILAVWTLSLLQFSLVLTATRKPRVARNIVSGQNPERQKKRGRSRVLCETEIWSILTTVLMQDGPFLAVRLYVIFQYHVINYTILFYTGKNALILTLQGYRIIVVMIEASQTRKSGDQPTTARDSSSVRTSSVHEMSPAEMCTANFPKERDLGREPTLAPNYNTRKRTLKSFRAGRLPQPSRDPFHLNVIPFSNVPHRQNLPYALRYSDALERLRAKYLVNNSDMT